MGGVWPLANRYGTLLTIRALLDVYYDHDRRTRQEP
jgi:hypothetical protein